MPWTAVAVVVLVAALSPAPARSAPADVEALLLQQVNTGRSGVGKAALVMHAGLRVRAREHSSHMAAEDELNHDGFEQRLTTAPPDPAEGNGAPDDGFNLDGACENVALRNVPGETDTQAAAGLFTQWLNSADHKKCMFDESAPHTVTGVGIVKDGNGTWWATLLAVRDLTLSAVSPGAPVFDAGSPCGQLVAAPLVGPATVVDVSASDPQGQSVTLAAGGVPAWAVFSSSPGPPATGSLTITPTLLALLAGLIGSTPTVTVAATDTAGDSSACVFEVVPTLL